MNLTFPDGVNLNIIPDDILYFNLATADFSPSEDPSPSEYPEDGGVDHIMDKGFYVRPQAAGNLYGVTLRQYQKNGKSLSGIKPALITCAANAWIECRFVKIFATNDALYPTTASPINIGVIL